MNQGSSNQHPLGYGSTYREVRDERDFEDAVGVEVRKTCHSFSKHCVQIFVLYMLVGPINSVLSLAMISHLLRAPEPEYLAGP